MTERLRRAPAVPLVTFDPFISIWCCADRLTDDWPRHWTGTKMALYGVIRVDGVAHRFMGGCEWLPNAAEQTACEISATCTHYVFRAGPIQLDVDFVTPLLADDLDLLSRPVTYLRLRATTLDHWAHEVVAYVDMTGEMAVNLPHERVFWDTHRFGDVTAVAFRGEIQNVLQTAGDHRRIEWGTAYLAGRAGVAQPCIGDIDICRDSFARTGSASAAGLKPAPRKVDYNSDAVASLTCRSSRVPRRPS